MTNYTWTIAVLECAAEENSLNKVVKTMKEIIKEDGFIEISNFKERFDLSRKYLITYLDYLDNYSDIKKVKNRRVFV